VGHRPDGFVQRDPTLVRFQVDAVVLTNLAAAQDKVGDAGGEQSADRAGPIDPRRIGEKLGGDPGL